MPSVVRSASLARAAVLFALAALSLTACRRRQAPVATTAAATTVNQDSINAARAEAEARARREQFVRDSIANAERQRQSALEAARAALLAPVYFDYDAADIRDDARQALEAKLPLLTANAGLRIRVAGHTDSRGSDEYNLALGQRRASSVKAFFSERGVDAGRIEIVSFGEERGACADDAESCWSRNRRAEFEIASGGESLTVPGGAR
jgi:peptidoglycan-associated lipoprotein